MTVVYILCSIAIGFFIGTVFGANTQEKMDKEKCNACWDDMYSHAWTLTLDGKDIKVLPIYEYGRDGENKP